MNFCDGAGYSAGGNWFYPDDPSDHYRAMLPVVACNHLRCTQCGAEVTNVVDGDVRKYKCQCSSWEEKTEHRFFDPDPYPDDPQVPWRCAGHPVAELPREIDGIQLDDGNLAEVAKRSLGGWVPDGARPHDRGRAIWAARLHVRLEGSAWADRVAQAVADALTDDQPRVRGAALRFFMLIKHPIGHRRILEFLEGDRPLFAGVPDDAPEIEGDTTLEDALWRAAHPLVGSLEKARMLARAEALEPGRGRDALYSALAFHDGPWFAEHVAEIARATPARADKLIESIRFGIQEDDIPTKPLIAKVKAAVADLPKA